MRNKRYKGYRSAIKSTELLGELRALMQEMASTYSRIVNTTYKIAQYAINDVDNLSDASNDIISRANGTTEVAASLMESVVELFTLLQEEIDEPVSEEEVSDEIEPQNMGAEQ